MRTNQDSNELVQAFLANGGEIQKLPPTSETASQKRFREAAKAKQEATEAARTAIYGGG